METTAVEMAGQVVPLPLRQVLEHLLVTTRMTHLMLVMMTVLMETSAVVESLVLQLLVENRAERKS